MKKRKSVLSEALVAEDQRRRKFLAASRRGTRCTGRRLPVPAVTGKVELPLGS